MDKSDLARVLVVDDDERIVRLVDRLLVGSNIANRTATSAGEAMEMLRNSPQIDVVVSDIRMPVTDGIEFLGAVRREFADRPWLQLILVTGHASVETAVAAMRLEACDYLFKPIEPKALCDAVRHALNRADSTHQVRQTAADSGAASELQQIAVTATALAAEIRRNVQQLHPANRDDDGKPPASSLQTLRLLQKLLEARTTIFGDAVMPEPAWEMLAELMRAQLAGQHLSVTSLSLASRSPMTTALRRIEDLIQGGLATRVPDPADRRRTHVELTPEGMARMLIFLEGFARTVSARG